MTLIFNNSFAIPTKSANFFVGANTQRLVGIMHYIENIISQKNE